ncbi:hypothetical protein WBO78_27010 [Bosea sp. CCNWLW174]|uniref:hypothetical protein n=1 Tax=unclassified Bosea (in: a-proteobacteria) TaxID=2653178 RepID=UPI003014A058
MPAFTTAALKKYFEGYLDDAPIAFVISTTGDRSSKYVRANAAYLQLCGRAWTDIAGASLVEKGSAIPGAERIRRLWYLDNLGRYKNEVATIAHSSGKPVTVILSAQREIVDGTALDFEFLVEHRELSERRTHLGAGKSNVAPAPARVARRASFTPSIAKSLELMSSEYARSLIIEMLVSVTRGMMYLSQILPVGSPIVTYVNDYARRQFGEVPGPLAMERAPLVFATLSRDVAEEQLLNLATQIWVLARFQNPDTRNQLLSLVQPYTVAPNALVKA